MVTTAIIGGETGHRGKWSGRAGKGRVRSWAVVGFAAVVLMMQYQLLGAVIAILLALANQLAGISLGGEASILANLQTHRRWRFQQHHGLHQYRPLHDCPFDLTDPRLAVRVRNAYRARPDGATGLEWLQTDAGRPAIADHWAPGTTPYLSVTFAVDGPVVGVAGDQQIENAQVGFGRLMAGWGSAQKLVSGIQTTTRMLPADSTGHQVWLADELDPDAPEWLVRGYVSERLPRLDGFVQRHYVTLRWNREPRFTAAAALLGDGREGWCRLVDDQLDSALRRLRKAGYRHPQVLDGPHIAGVLRHLQNPDLPIDHTADVDTAWLPSTAEKKYVQTGGWVHRTAEIPISAIESRKRDARWLTPLLTGMTGQVIRTVSIHIQFVPAQQAKYATRLDVTGDQADIIAARNKGKLADDAAELSLSAAQARLNDIRSGSGQHGALWAGFITVSARTPEDLTKAVPLVEEAADACDIERLHWLDTMHAPAQSFTWPIARAFTPAGKSQSIRAVERLTARTAI